MGRPPGVTTSSPTLMQNSRPMPAAASTSTTLHPSKEHTPASTLSARAPNLSASHIYPAASSGLALAAILCQAKSIHPGVFKAIPFPSSLTTTIPMSSKVACPPQPQCRKGFPEGPRGGKDPCVKQRSTIPSSGCHARSRVALRCRRILVRHQTLPDPLTPTK